MITRVGLCVAVMLVATPLRAEGPKDAKAHYQRGISLYALGDYAGAADEYEKAFSLKADSALLYDAAQAHRRAGHNARALALYENYLAIFGNEVENRKEVQRKIDELRAALEAEKKAQSSPPVETVPMREQGGSHPPAGEPAHPAAAAESAPAMAPLTQPAPNPLVAQTPEQPERRRRTLMWALIGAGGAVVLGVGLGVGLGLGLSKTVTPTPSFGAIKVTVK